VVFKPNYTLWDHIGLKQSLEDLLGRRVDVLEKDLREGFRSHILPDAVPISASS
jgi:predicted nucleotidyltransferase